MTRSYSTLTRRDRAIDAAAMAERATEVGPLLDAAADDYEPEPQPERWVVRSWTMGTEPRQFFSVLTYDRCSWASEEFTRRAETAKRYGGAVELLSPTGEVASSFMSGGGE